PRPVAAERASGSERDPARLRGSIFAGRSERPNGQEETTVMSSTIQYRSQPPDAQGLYDPRNEHDACGVGFIVNIAGEKSHKLVDDAVEILVNLQHRGACGCEDNTGDGAGMMLQVPQRFLTKACGEIGIALPEQPGEWGVGMIFLPSDAG